MFGVNANISNAAVANDTVTYSTITQDGTIFPNHNGPSYNVNDNVSTSTVNGISNNDINSNVTNNNGNAHYTVSNANNTAANANHTVSNVNHTMPNANHTVINTNYPLQNVNHTIPNANHTVPNANYNVPNANHIVFNGLSRKMEINFQLHGTPYVLEKVIGSGAYGAVGQALDTRSGTNVAIKKIARAFAALTLVKRTLREVRILREIEHENIVSVLDMFATEGCHGRDIYLVMDLMETDLHQIIHSTQKLTEQHNQYFLFQILRGLKYLHSVGIVHRDMKPSNLLVNGNCLLKIADFGMARSIEQCVRDEGSIMTQYVSTRWYRAPELLFSMLDYDTKVDIWSAGCIFAEMIMRRQLFPGRDAAMQIKMIVCYLGSPGSEIMEKISSQLVRVWIEKCGARMPLPWTTILPKATAKAVDLIEKLMLVASWRRCSAEEALAHPYLDLYHDPDNEPVGARQIQFDADAIEQLESTCLKDALLAEAQYFGALPQTLAGGAQPLPTTANREGAAACVDASDQSQVTTIEVNPSPHFQAQNTTTIQMDDAMDAE